jgi:hypothetical protein
MATIIRLSEEISRLYDQLVYQISNKNEEEIRRTYRELLGTGESLGEIMSVAMSSVYQMENRRESGGDEAATNKLPEAQRAPVELRPTELRQSAWDAPLQQAPGVDGYIDRLERLPVIANDIREVDGHDRRLNAWPAPQRAQTEFAQTNSEAETPGLAVTDEPGDIDIHRELSDRVTKIGNGSRLISPIIGAIIVLTVALVATAGISLLRVHRPADENRAAAPQPALSLPPIQATAVGASGLSGTAASATVAVESATLNVETRPTVTTPGEVSTAKTAAIAAPPAIIPAAPSTATAGGSNAVNPGPDGSVPAVRSAENAPTEVRISPSEAAALRQRGDALLATGDVASARLFYERAATAGDAMAALRSGEAHDPQFLAEAGITGVRGDRAVAARWYRRAAELGAREADILLKRAENQRE